jgi:RNA-splicing ligase RtcB
MTITGKHLIDMGYEPAKWFGKAIEYINNNEVPEDQLRLIIESFIPKNDYNVLVPHQQPVQYDKFLDAVNEEELFNLISVEQTMDVVMMTPTVVSGAIMPDACPSGKIGHIPVGGLVVTDNAIHPSMHSADICCSVMITGFGENSPQRILNTIHNLTEFGGGGRRKAQKFHLPDELYKKIDNNRFFSDKAKAMAVSHLGTQGDGNHFSFVGTSKKTGETCLVTHHGSRGLGAQLYKAGMLCADKWRKKLCPSLPTINGWIPYDSEDGVEYWEALQIVREWTKLNHEVLHFGVRDKIKFTSKLHFWNEHNFIFKKDNLFYHAKGSTPMLDMIPDNNTGLRLIPLNMAQPILIVSNNENNKTGFAPHGAGRNLSRTAFIKKGLNIQDEIKGLDVRFYFNNPDVSEYPSAYKNAEQLKEQIQKYNLANIEDEILPYGCIMAGNSDYKNEIILERND